MLGVHAQTNVAFVKNEQPLWNRSNGEPIGNSVSESASRLCSIGAASVSVGIYCSGPKPARFGFVHARPERIIWVRSHRDETAFVAVVLALVFALFALVSPEELTAPIATHRFDV